MGAWGMAKASHAKAKLYHFDLALSGKVDPENGIVRGVSLITGGIKARGHDLEVDDTTLEQVLQLAVKAGKVPVKWNHKTGADAVNGYLTDCYLDGNKVKGDWHLLQSHSQFKQALELATRMPENVGLSVAFLGKEAVVKGTKRARCEELVSADLVAQPAANPDGLFEEGPGAVRGGGVDRESKAKLMDTPNAAPETDKEPTLAELRDLIVAQNETINQLSETVRGIESDRGELSDAELDQLAGLGDEELAKYDITRDQVDAAIASRDGGGPEAVPAGTVETPAAGKEVMAEMADLRRRVTHFERKEKADEEAADKAAIEQAFEVVETKVVELAARNDALEHALKQVPGSAVSASGEITFSRPLGAEGLDTRNMTEFEVAVEAHRATGKKHTEAILLAQKEDRGRYMKHLEAKGVGLKSL